MSRHENQLRTQAHISTLHGWLVHEFNHYTEAA